MLVIDSSKVIVENQLKCFWCSRKHVVSSIEDHILVENLYKFKGYRAKNSKFPDKGWTINGLNYLLKKLRDTGMGVDPLKK